MNRLIGRLSAARVRTARPKPGRTVLVIGDGGGLWLQCTLGEGGHVRRSWVFRYGLNGRRREMGLGATHTLSLAEARDKARALRQQLLDDIDPLDAKQAAKREQLAEQAKAMTFRQCAEAYITLHADSWRSAKHRAQWSSTLATYAFPLLGDMSVRDIDPAAVFKVVEPIWKVKGETAARVRGRIESILDYASASGFRSGDNPARHVLRSLPKRSGKVHHTALPYLEMPALMAALRRQEDTASRALELCILTASRRGEVVGAIWSEFDLTAKVWTIPDVRMKAGKEHRVPLCDRALRILSGLPRHGKSVFGVDAQILLRRLQTLRPGITLHGCRATFKTWAGEQTNFAREVAEQALAHAIGDAVERAYARGDLFDRRCKLMQAWSDYCSKPAPTGATVVPLHKVTADA
jgi:integrase